MSLCTRIYSGRVDPVGVCMHNAKPYVIYAHLSKRRFNKLFLRPPCNYYYFVASTSSVHYSTYLYCNITYLPGL